MLNGCSKEQQHTSHVANYERAQAQRQINLQNNLDSNHTLTTLQFLWTISENKQQQRGNNVQSPDFLRTRLQTRALPSPRIEGIWRDIIASANIKKTIMDFKRKILAYDQRIMAFWWDDGFVLGTCGLLWFFFHLLDLSWEMMELLDSCSIKSISCDAMKVKQTSPFYYFFFFMTVVLSFLTILHNKVKQTHSVFAKHTPSGTIMIVWWEDDGFGQLNSFLLLLQETMPCLKENCGLVYLFLWWKL